MTEHFTRSTVSAESDEEQFLDELDDLIIRGYLRMDENGGLVLTPKGKAAASEARKS